MLKLPGFARGTIRKGIDALWKRRLARGYDPQRTIILSSTPRGGSTWVMETLARTPGYLALMEPLNPLHIRDTLANAVGTVHLWEPLAPFASRAPATSAIGHDFFVTPKSVLHLHMKRLISGQIHLSEYLMQMGFRYFMSRSLRNILAFQRLVLKFVRANLLLHWMLNEFNVKGVLILRHPCAVVASQMHHMDWGNPATLEDIRKDRLPIYEQYDPSFKNVIRSVKSPEELLALEWCIRTLVPLRQPKPHPWFLTVYESLIEDMGEWEKMCHYLDCPVPPKDLVLRLSSTSVRRENESSPSVAVNKWRRHLSEKQIDDILRVCSDMGVDFYDKSLYPKNLDKYKS